MLIIPESEGNFTIHSMKNRKDGTTTIVQIFTNTQPVACPCCGQHMCKNGFTHYPKTVTSIGETMGVQNAKHIEPFYPQRLICRNPLCASRQRAPGIHGGETHVLLPESVTPRSNLRSEDIDLITDIHQLLHDMDEEDKKQGRPRNRILAQRIDAVLQNNTLHERIKNLCPPEPYYIRDFFDTFIFCTKGKEIFKVCSKLRENIKALDSIKFSNEHPGEQYTPDESALKKISNIIRIHCSQFVRIISTAPKYSISYMVRKMGISDEKQPIADSS